MTILLDKKQEINNRTSHLHSGYNPEKSLTFVSLHMSYFQEDLDNKMDNAFYSKTRLIFSPNVKKGRQLSGGFIAVDIK